MHTEKCNVLVYGKNMFDCRYGGKSESVTGLVSELVSQSVKDVNKSMKYEWMEGGKEGTNECMWEGKNE